MKFYINKYQLKINIINDINLSNYINLLKYYYKKLIPSFYIYFIHL